MNTMFDMAENGLRSLNGAGPDVGVCGLGDGTVNREVVVVRVDDEAHLGQEAVFTGVGLGVPMEEYVLRRTSWLTR